MKLLDLFSGIGGFSLGLERAGFETVAFCEYDKKAQMVLKKHWPEIKIYDDVKKLTRDRLEKDGIVIPDAICGGFPCQDISIAGKGAGLAGERSGLWFEFHRLIAEIRPKYAIIENVSALRSRGLEEVLRSLLEIGYDAEWNYIPATAAGLPHVRNRLFIVAYPDSDRFYGERIPQEQWEDLSRTAWSNNKQPRDALPMPTDKTDKPGVLRIADGVPDRMDRIKQLGNAVVPQIPEMIGRAILTYERSIRQGEGTARKGQNSQ